MSASAITAGRAVIELGILDKTQAEIAAVGNRLQTMGGSIMSAGAKVALGGLGLMGLFAKPLQYAADLQDAMASFEVMLGSAEKAETMLARIREMAAKTPFETTDLTKATQTLLQFGVAEGEVLETMRRLGDVSGGNSERFASLALAFGQASSAGRVMGQDVLQMINAGWNPLKTIAEMTGETMGDVKKRMEAGAVSIDELKSALQKVTSEGGLFFGLMDKKSQMLWGRLSTLKDSIVMALTPIGEAIAPLAGGFLSIASIAVDVFGAISPYLSWVWKGLFLVGVALTALAAPLLALGAGFAVVGTVIGGLISTMFGLGIAFKLLFNYAGVVATLGNVFSILGNPLAKLAPLAASAAFSIRGLFTAASLAPGPIGLVAGSFIQLARGGKVLGFLSSSFLSFTSLFGSGWTKVFPFISRFNSMLGPLPNLVIDGLALIPGPIGMVASAFSRLSIATGIAGFANKAFAGPLGTIVRLFLKLVGAIPFIGGALSLLTGPVGLVIAAVSGLAYLFWDDLKPAFDWLLGAVSGLFERLGAAFGEIKAVFGNMFGKMVEDLKRIYQGIKDITGLGESSEEKAIREEQEAYEKEEAERVARSNREQAAADKANEAFGPEAAKTQTFATFSARSAQIAGMGVSGDKGVKGAVEKGNAIAQSQLEVEQGAAANQEKLNRMFKFG